MSEFDEAVKRIEQLKKEVDELKKENESFKRENIMYAEALIEERKQHADIIQLLKAHQDSKEPQEPTVDAGLREDVRCLGIDISRLQKRVAVLEK